MIKDKYNNSKFYTKMILETIANQFDDIGDFYITLSKKLNKKNKILKNNINQNIKENILTKSGINKKLKN